ncbi:hypothetical protein B0H11DRAFT_2348643 [Mycena galericulata]|nr:hypothetical protein B0H11DRAFT_2348643 [Mycena galericulata]
MSAAGSASSARMTSAVITLFVVLPLLRRVPIGNGMSHRGFEYTDERHLQTSGFDLCFGCWDTHTHPLADVHPTDFSRTLFPGPNARAGRAACLIGRMEAAIQLRSANIPPTAYTYKLLMDAYGRIEPVKNETMEQMWARCATTPRSRYRASHFVSLINAYGCVQIISTKAVAVFSSFPRALPRDALVFEAMINTLGMHITAYIANFLIKGYTDVGDMARDL